MDAIVLAGGFGTRLQQLVKDIPKPMALINNRPFLEYLLNYLKLNKIQKIILSVGYKHEVIFDYFKTNFNNIELVYSIEDEPLGTGGGIKKATELVQDDTFFVINGDTLFDIDLTNMLDYHNNNNCDITIALKYFNDNSRYGSVKIDDKNKVTGFIEKNEKSCQSFINGGIYIINKIKFNTVNLPYKFSFEKDFLEKYYNVLNIQGLSFNNYFLDIGIPQDYNIAQNDFKHLKY